MRSRPCAVFAAPIQFLATVLVAVGMVSLASPAAAKQDYSGIVMDAKTGKVLYAHREDARAFPASLTKMMTLYMVFEQIEQGKLSKNTAMRVSSRASSMQPSKINVKAGSTISVDNAIKALVTKSANDVAVVIAEHIAGSESRFAELMTSRARSLGMKSTTFKNASGLPNDAQVTTARDMARLGIALREHFPRHYGYFETRSFTYAGRRYGNHNRLLGAVSGVDGIKTGYTRASGFNLVTSVERDGRSIVGVVLGGRTSASRNAQMTKLISQYLGKASRGEDRQLIAKVPVTGGVHVARLPTSDIPVPQASPLRATASALAYAPAAAPAPIPAPQVAIDTTQTASVTPSGWMIQVAALGSNSEALEMLDRVRSRAASAVAHLEPVVLQFEKGGIVYHRARFAGFSSQNEAVAACRALKKAKFACYATEG